MKLLALGGLHFRIYHTGVAHTDGDLMVEVVEDKVMFMGDNAVVERTARLDDGHFLGNIEACEVALRTGAQHFRARPRQVQRARRGDGLS